MKALDIRVRGDPNPGPAPDREPAPPLDARWRFSRLLDAPHRLGFFAAAVMMASSALWWALVLVGGQLGLSLPWAVPPTLAHGLLMALAFMPLFIVGFLFTAGPRWLGLPDVPAASLHKPVLAMVAGWVLALAGFHWGAAAAALGVASVALGWSALVLHFMHLLRSSRSPDKLHARWVALSCALGALALWLAAWALFTGQHTGLRMATQMGLWLFLAPVFATVSHRMIPFFTASALPALQAWRPNALLWLMVGVLWLQGVAAVADLWWAPAPLWVAGAQALITAPLALLLLGVAWRWGLVQSLRIRLLAMLHAGFVWLGIALALAAVSQAMRFFSDGASSLGLAPLHALSMGYLGATLIAMITRVAAGHSGRALAADGLAWALYWLLQTAAVLRVGAALWPGAGTALTLLAVGAWAAAALGWAWRYGGWLGRPRSDGRPG